MAQAPTMAQQLHGKSIGLFALISRVDEEQRLVYGVATDETPVREWAGIDLDVVISHAATKRAVDRWMKWGNIREMHQPSAVGVARSVEFNDQTHETYVTAHIVDDQAWEKVKAGVYRGFSIAGPITKFDHDKKLKRVTVTDYELDELSLCDRPKNPTSLIKLWQAVGVPGDLMRAESLWIAGGDPYLHVVDIETAWDESGAIAAWIDHSTEDGRVNWAEYGRMFMLRDAANPEAVESYQMPFAAVASFKYYAEGEEHEELACIPAGLFAAVTAMQGMTDLSDTTQRALERRCEMYYHSIDRRAPWEIQQAKTTGGQDMSSALWKVLMGEEAMPEDAARAAELIRTKLTPPQIKIEGVPLEPSAELKRALDGLGNIEAQLATMDERLKRVEAMPVMPIVQRTESPELSLDAEIEQLERAISDKNLTPDSPEVKRLMRLHQQKRTVKPTK